MNVSILRYHSMFDGALGIEIGVGGPQGPPLSLSAIDAVSIVQYVSRSQPVHRVELELLDGWDADGHEDLDSLVASLTSVKIAVWVTLPGSVLPSFAMNLPRIALIDDQPWLQYQCMCLVYSVSEKPPMLRDNVATTYWVTAKNTKEAWDFIRSQRGAIQWRLWPKSFVGQIQTDLKSLDFPSILKGEPK